MIHHRFSGSLGFGPRCLAGVFLLSAGGHAFADCFFEPTAAKAPYSPLQDRVRSANAQFAHSKDSSGTTLMPDMLKRGGFPNQASTSLNPGDRVMTTHAAPPMGVSNHLSSNPNMTRLAQLPSLAAVWQPLRSQTEVFGIDPSGALKDVWKQDDGFWQPAFPLSRPGFAPPGAPLAAVWQPLNEQLEVFTLTTDGTLKDVWKQHNSAWSAPLSISPPNFAPACAHLAAVVQPLNNQLEVFAIDASGALKETWKVQNGAWQRPVALTPPNAAPAGAPLTAVWQPLNEQLEVFWIDPSGSMRSVWKQHNQGWHPMLNLTVPALANPGANVAAVWQPLNEQLEIFTIDQTGAMKDVYKAHNSAWMQPLVIFGPGYARPGAALAASWDPRKEALQVITVGLKGELLQAFKTHNGRWAPGPQNWTQPLAPVGTAFTASPLAVTFRPSVGHNEVFVLDAQQQVRVVLTDNIYSGGHSDVITRSNFTPIYGAHAAYCTAVLKRWSGGYDGDTFGARSVLQDCMDFMGITAHCDHQGAFVTVGYPPQAQLPRFVQCSSRVHPDSVVEQAEHIGRGIAQGTAEAMVAAAPFYSLAIQGYACIDGVIFACATLAVDVAARVAPIPQEINDAADLVNLARECASEDVVACAKLGAAGARAAGLQIPGEDAGQIALLTQQCVNEDYAACLRLGEKAAAAAGVPIDALNQAAKNAQECYAGDADACIALGRQAAQAGIPIGGVVEGASSLRQCSLGSVADCQQVGQALASVPR